MTNKIDAMRSPLKNVKGLGSAKSGTHHWLLQRVTGLGLVFLSVWFMTMVLRFFTCETPLEMLRILASPMNTVLFIVMVMVMLYHGALGMVVIFEDYMHCSKMKATSIWLLYAITTITAVAGVCAVVTTHVMLLG